jgi:putative ABC transport system permease protein
MEQLLQDVRYGLRLLRKSPGFALTAILILAVGIGANTAVFSMVNSILLHPLPYPDAERLTMMRDVNGDTLVPMSYPKFQAWRGHKEIFEEVAAYFTGSTDLTSPGEPQQLPVIHVSTEFLPMLGTDMRFGRTFNSQEELADGPPAVILSYSFWQNRFRNDRAAVGATLTLDDKVYTIVGVLPEEFRFSGDPALLLPLRLNTETAPPRYNFIHVMSKIRSGLSLAQARQAANVAVAGVNEASSSVATVPVSIVPLQEFLIGDSRPLLLALLGTVAFVLLIACANTANLLLARAASREKEIAIRVSVGCARTRLIRQLLTESMLLSILGGALGLFIAQWGIGILTGLLSDRLPRTATIHMDISALVFTGVVSLLTGVLFGLFPALSAGRNDLTDRLKQGGRFSGAGSSQRLRNVLVIAEIAFSLVLLAGAGLLLRSFMRLANVDKGFDADHVLTMHIAVSPVAYLKNSAEAVYLDQIVQRTKVLPGVDAAGLVTDLPFSGDAMSGNVFVEGIAADMDNPPIASKQFVGGDYFKAMHIPLIKGRYLNDRDTSTTSAVVVVDQEFVKLFMPGIEPIGHRMDMSWGNPGMREIVGVVGNIHEMALTAPPTPTVYTPIAQKPELLKFLAFNLAVRTKLDPLALAQSVSNQIHQLDSTQVVAKIRTMDDLMNVTLSPRRAPMWLFGVFSAIALFLAAVGIYGVLSFYVLQRRQEIGTRIALGAQRSDVLKLILGHAFKLITAGVVVGLIAAFAAARALTSMLFGVRSTDLPTFLGVTLLLATLAMIACAVPALRAMRVDPLVVLRNE